jgi:hypothetical protein
MNEKLYNQLIKEQKKLRSRLSNKSQKIGELLWQVDRLEARIYLINFYSRIVLYSLITSVILNLYFLFND